MSSPFIYELESSLRLSGIDDPVLLRRVLMENLANCPTDCDREDVDRIFGFQCGEWDKHNVYVALSNKKILSLIISKMGIGLETEQTNYKDAFASYFAREEFRDAPVPGVNNIEWFLSYLIKNGDAELLDYLLELIHPDICPLLIYQTFRHLKERSNSSVCEAVKKYAERYEQPYNEITKGIKLAKWKSAEEQCAEIETSMGNAATCVGAKNLGYDVLSKTPDGKTRYIEVKLLTSDMGTFSLTNNEYSTAHQLGDEFYLCLLVQRSDGISVTYINDPIENLQLEKRVRQWEWVCNEFNGESFFYPY